MVLTRLGNSQLKTGFLIYLFTTELGFPLTFICVLQTSEDRGESFKDVKKELDNDLWFDIFCRLYQQHHNSGTFMDPEETTAASTEIGYKGFSRLRDSHLSAGSSHAT